MTERRATALDHRPSRIKPQVGLLDAKAADGAGDDELLDLLRALEDVVGLLELFGSRENLHTVGFWSARYLWIWPIPSRSSTGVVPSAASDPAT